MTNKAAAQQSVHKKEDARKLVISEQFVNVAPLFPLLQVERARSSRHLSKQVAANGQRTRENVCQEEHGITLCVPLGRPARHDVESIFSISKNENTLQTIEHLIIVKI